mmetsp:Transcript_32481/g.63484  ORF Transcript_32481/g.63484 Transcript_32481/m.63484 type:complete len:288 (+) Transcript_32481:49-912(+)
MTLPFGAFVAFVLCSFTTTGVEGFHALPTIRSARLPPSRLQARISVLELRGGGGGGGEHLVPMTAVEMYVGDRLPEFEVSKAFKKSLQSMGHVLLQKLISKCHELRASKDKDVINEAVAGDAVVAAGIDEYCKEFMKKFNASKSAVRQSLKKRKLSEMASNRQFNDSDVWIPFDKLTEEEKRERIKQANEYAEKKERATEEEKKRKEAAKMKIKNEMRDRKAAVRKARVEAARAEKEAAKKARKAAAIHMRQQKREIAQEEKKKKSLRAPSRRRRKVVNDTASTPPS